MLCGATCPLPAGEHPCTVLIKGRTFAPLPPAFWVCGGPEEMCSLMAVLKGFVEFPLSTNDPNQKPQGEPRLCSEQTHKSRQGIMGWQCLESDQAQALAREDLRSHYPCKRGLCSKALVRVYTSICALDQVIENWSHLCKLYNNQEEGGSVTPGCKKETSLVIRHKAGLEVAAAAAASN